MCTVVWSGLGIREKSVKNPDQAFQFDADPDSTFHFNVDPDPAPHQKDENLRLP